MFIILALAVLLLTGIQSCSPAQPPNIAIIMGDDQGKYGDVIMEMGLELYNLEKDLSENSNVAGRNIRSHDRIEETSLEDSQP